MKLLFIPLVAALGALAGCAAEATHESPDDLYGLADEFLKAGAPTEAMEFYHRAARGGNARALLVVAHHDASSQVPDRLVDAAVAESVVSTRAHANALEALVRLGEEGDAEALMLAGLMTFLGRGIVADSARGRSLIGEATALGSAEAPFWLGWTFERNHRFREAATEYERAIAMGYERAFVELAMLHIDGSIADESFARGMAMLRVAHERGDARAGELFLKLLERTEHSAANGSSLAKERLSAMKMTGFREVTWLGSY